MNNKTSNNENVKSNYDVYRFEDNFSKYKDIPSVCIRKSNTATPKFSILIPTYKRPDTLKETIDSAINQLDYYDDYEILIVSNDPEDVNKESDTYQLLSGYIDENISYYVNSQNLGLCGNWNRGTELAQGEYIVMIHDDDILGPYVLYSLNRVLQEKPECGIIGCGHIDFSGKLPIFKKPESIHYRIITKKSFFFGIYISIAGMTYNKQLVKNIGGFNEKYYPNEDTNLIYQGILYSEVIRINETLTAYRKEVNLSLSGNTMYEIIENTENLRKNIAENEKFARSWMEKYDRDFLLEYIDGANGSWNLNVDANQLLTKFNMENVDSAYRIPLALKVKEKIYQKLFLLMSEKTIRL